MWEEIKYWARPGMAVPFLGFRRMPTNRDGTPFDSGERDLFDERAPFFVRIFAFEWLGFGLPLWPFAYVRDAKTGERVRDNEG